MRMTTDSLHNLSPPNCKELPPDDDDDNDADDDDVAENHQADEEYDDYDGDHDDLGNDFNVTSDVNGFQDSCDFRKADDDDEDGDDH
eukprot:10933601-Karenia_brevis.AAC.1